MTIVLDANAQVIYDTITLPTDALPGSTLISMYQQVDFRFISDLDDVETLQIDVIRATQATYAELKAFVLTEIVPNLASQNFQMLAYSIYEQPLQDVEVPTNICLGDQCYSIPQICIPGTAWLCGGQDCCFGGNSHLSTAYRYRFWVLSRSFAPSSPMAFRPFIPILAILALGLVFVVALYALVNIEAFRNGKITWSQYKEAFNGIYKIPQENNPLAPIAGAFPWGMAALGGTMVAISLALGYVYSKGGVAPPVSGHVEVPAGPVTGGVAVGGAPAAPTRGGRR
ncbi:MAG: hypothetical protein Q8R28_19025 [Dehalococcoidia bacterium]|nr:hypothetical protein [Dehalococcoidia bacterium]